MNFGKNMKEVEEPSLKNFETDKIETLQSQIHQERMRNAPKIVQDYYNGKALKFEKGLFRVLVAKKSNRIIFFIMILCLGITFFIGKFGNKGNLLVINGYECELKAFFYDDTVFANVKVHPIQKLKKELSKLNQKVEKNNVELINNDFSFPITIQFFGISEDDVQIKFPEEINNKIFLDSNIYRTKTDDYNIKKVVAKITIGNKSDELIVNVSKLQQ